MIHTMMYALGFVICAAAMILCTTMIHDAIERQKYLNIAVYVSAGIGFATLAVVALCMP